MGQFGVRPQCTPAASADDDLPQLHFNFSDLYAKFIPAFSEELVKRALFPGYVDFVGRAVR
jgi:hypothetical protein